MFSTNKKCQLKDLCADFDIKLYFFRFYYFQQIEFEWVMRDEVHSILKKLREILVVSKMFDLKIVRNLSTKPFNPLVCITTYRIWHTFGTPTLWNVFFFFIHLHWYFFHYIFFVFLFLLLLGMCPPLSSATVR